MNVEWTIRSVLAWAKDYLTQKNIETPRLDSEILLSEALKIRRLDLYLDMDRPLSTEELSFFRPLIKRRSEKEPVAYILGKKEFYSLEFEVNTDVLIPRPATEIIVEQAIKRIPQNARILEIGTGSGAVIISVLHERADLSGCGIDISEAALAITGKNAVKHSVKDRLELNCSDGLENVEGQFDAILMNPPYIPEDDVNILSDDVLKYEPRTALFAGKDGLDIIEKILKDIKKSLAPKGELIMEAGKGQRKKIEALIEPDSGLNIVEWIKDYSGIDRTVIVKRV